MANGVKGKRRLRQDIKGLHGNFYGLLISLLLLFLVYPFFERTPFGRAVLGTVTVAVLIAGVYSLSGDRRFFYIALALAFPALAGQVSRMVTGEEILFDRVAQGTALLFFIYVTLTVLALVMKAGKVTADRLCGAASVYLLMGLTWALAYTLLHGWNPGAFEGMVLADTSGRAMPSNFFYYSFVTLTTLGYGDIQPVSSQARTLSVLESTCGVLYIAILISRLVAMYSGGREYERGEAD